MARRILLVDDHAVVRRGVRSLLESHEGWEVCGEASIGRDAVAESLRLRPDVVVMDLSLPELNGLDATDIVTRRPFVDSSTSSMRPTSSSMSSQGSARSAICVVVCSRIEDLGSYATGDRLGCRRQGAVLRHIRAIAANWRVLSPLDQSRVR